MSKKTENTTEDKFDGFIYFVGMIVFIWAVCVSAGVAWGFGYAWVRGEKSPIDVCIEKGFTVTWQTDPHDEKQLLLVCS